MNIFKRKKIELTTPTEVYALEPGKIYLMEAFGNAVNRASCQALSNDLKKQGIDIKILITTGGERSLHMITPEQICTTGCATKRCKRANREIK